MRAIRIRSLAALGIALSLFCGLAVHAVDGVNEINDASITAAGGYPLTISTSGSYVLTGNLTPPAGIGALTVSVPDVDIDLNGFSIVGSGGGAGDGIDATGLAGLSVQDGTITGMGGSGIVAGSEARILRVRVRDSGAFGIDGVAGCVIVESVFSENVAGGISASGCKIENNVVRDNDDAGIIGGNNVIVHNEIVGNGATASQGGVLCFAGCTIQENVIVGNSDYGISDTPGPAAGLPVPAPTPMPGLGWPAVPVGHPPPNTIMKNTIAGSPAGFGIYSNVTGLITDNSITTNMMDGIVCGGTCTIRGNQINGNNLGGASNGGVTAGEGSVVNDNSISFNTGVGLVLHPATNYTNNSLTGNTSGAQDVAQVLPPAGFAHPSSGFFNLCGGVAGPTPRCP